VSNLLTEGQKQIANTTDLAAPGWGDTYKCKGWCSNNDSPYSWAKKCTWDLHCAACDECKMMQQCKPKCKNLAKAGDSWADLCAWPQGKNCHGCPECPELDTHSDMDWPEDSPLECKDCDNGYECGVCLMEIPANECLAEIPVGSGDDNYCTGPAGQGSPIQAHMGELCVERAGDCGTHGSLDNCPLADGVNGKHYHGIYRRVECQTADPPPTSPPPMSPPPPPSLPPSPPPPLHTSDHATHCQAGVGKQIYYLDRHYTACPAQQLLQQWWLQPWHCHGDGVQMHYRCTIPLHLGVTTMYDTGCVHHGSAWAQYMDRYHVDCGPGKVLQTWRFKTNECGHGHSKIKYMCVDTYVASTTVEYTNCNDMGDKGLHYLDRHNLDCGSGRALQGFTVTQEHGCHYPNYRFKYKCAELGAIQETQKLLPGLMIGTDAIQISRTWRIKAIDNDHLCIGHKGGKTAQIFRGDGTLHPGPRTDWNPWHHHGHALALGNPSGITVGDNMIQIGETWRIGALDSNHLCIGHKDGKTVQIFRNDGTLHPGPRTDWNPWSKELGNPSGVTSTSRYLQIGNFRIGANDDNHLSVGQAFGKTSQIYRNDGTLHPGSRGDWNPYAMAMMMRSPADDSKTLDVAGNRLIMWGDIHGGWNQMFYFETWPPPARIKSYYNWHKCLDYNFRDGYPVMWDCHGGNNQKWYFADGPQDTVPNTKADARRIKSLHNGKCLDISHGKDLVMWDCHGGNNQKFYFTEPTIRAMFDSSLDLLALENFTANISDDFHDPENLLAYQNFFEAESDGEAAAEDAP
jgi:hypothetical protein